jgi:hypothetical protein
MKSNYKRYLLTVVLTWTGFFAPACLVYLMVLAPQRKFRQQLDAELAGKLRTYEAAKIASQEKTKLRLDEQIRRLRTKLDKFVIDFEDSRNLTFDISQIAGEKEVASFSINRKDLAAKAELPDCERICEEHISVNFTAEFNQFAALVNALERHQPAVFVDNFSITRSRSGGAGHPVNMELAVFVRKQLEKRTPNTI